MLKKDKFIRLLLKVVSYRAISINESHITLWTVPMAFYPHDMMAEIYQEGAKLFGNKFFYSIFFLGKLQGYNGTSILVKKYGFKYSPSAIDIFKDQSQLVGFGVSEVVSIHEKNKELKINLNPSHFGQVYFDLYGKQKKAVCHYFRGLISGAVEALLGGDMISVETKCIAKGDPFCQFEIKEASKWNTKKPYVKNQLYEEGFYDFENIKKKENLTRLLTKRK